MAREISSWDRARAGARRPVSAPPNAGASRAVDEVDWSGQPVTIEAAGLVLPAGGGEVITSAVESHASVRRRGEAYYRRRTGWVAQRTRILFFVQDQPLRPRADGKFSAAGAWQPPQVTVYDAAERVEVRIGDVPVDTTATPPEQTAPGAGPGPVDGMVTSRAEDELAFLPAPVRRSVRARAVHPVYFDAQTLRYTRPDGSWYHTASVVRLDEREGIVVLASRQAGASTWQAEQFLHRFRAGPALQGPRSGRHPWLGRS